MIKLFAPFILLFFYACSPTEKTKVSPMLWEITGNHLSKPSYIFGTFHTRNAEINNLPTIVLSKLRHSQRLYTEIPITEKSTNKIIHFSKAIPPKPLKQRIDPKILKKLSIFLRTTNTSLHFKTLHTFKIWAIALMVSNQKDEHKNPNTLFMDEYLIEIAKKSHIKHMGLETPLEQLHYFDILSQKEQNLFLFEALHQADNTDYALALQKWYQKGEATGFLKLQKQFTSQNPKQQHLDKKLLQGLLFERNHRFIRRINILLQNNPSLSYFFAIGAGHLSGEKSILTGLKKLGYTIHKL